MFKFRLEIAEHEATVHEVRDGVLEPTRLIPTPVKLELWKRAARTEEAALEELRANAGSQFDPAVVGALERVLPPSR